MLNTVIAKIAFLFLAAYFVSYFLTPLVRVFCTVLGMIDVPGERRVHQRPVPRGVGLSVVLSFHLVLILAIVLGRNPVFTGSQFDIQWYMSYILATGILLVVGLGDDLYHLGALYKLAGQCAAAVVMYLGGVHFSGEILGLTIGPEIGFLATIFWFLLVTNAFNLIDGFDGLASGLAIIGGLGLMGVLMFRDFYHEAIVIAGFLGACLGFLRYNLHPASVFLGDTGSLFIGFSMATFSLSTSLTGTGFAAIWIPITAVGVPLFDTFLAVWRRLIRRVLSVLMSTTRKGGVMSADMEHIHHRLASAGLTPRNVTASLYLLSSVLVLLGLINLAYQNNFVLVLCFVAFMAVCYFFIRFTSRTELWESGMVIVLSLGARGNSLLAAACFALLDCLGSIILLLFLLRIYHVKSEHFSVTAKWGELALLYSIFPVLAILVYDYLWNRSSYALRIPGGIGRALVAIISCLLCAIVAPYFNPGDSLANYVLISGAMGILFAVYANVVRMMPDRVEQIMLLNLKYSGVPVPEQRVIICGTDEDCVKFFEEFDRRPGDRAVYGAILSERVEPQRLPPGRLLGELQQIEEVLGRMQIDEIIIVSTLDLNQQIKILRAVREKPIKVTVNSEELLQSVPLID